MKTLVLSKKDIEGLLTYESAIENVEYVFREWGRGNVVMPAKINLDMSGDEAKFGRKHFRLSKILPNAKSWIIKT